MAHRIERINEEIKKELSILLKSDIKDPRISGMISITNVKVTNDLRYAKVYVSIYGTDQQREDSIKGLESAGGYLRKEIGKKIRLRYVPELIFVQDNSIEYGMHIESILK